MWHINTGSNIRFMLIFKLDKWSQAMLFSLSFFVALTYIYLIFAIVLSMFIKFIVRNCPHVGIDSLIVEKKMTTYNSCFLWNKEFCMFYVNYLQHMYCCGLQLVNISVKFSIWYQLEMFDVGDLMLISCQYYCDNVWKDTRVIHSHRHCYSLTLFAMKCHFCVFFFSFLC